MKKIKSGSVGRWVCILTILILAARPAWADFDEEDGNIPPPPTLNASDLDDMELNIDQMVSDVEGASEAVSMSTNAVSTAPEPAALTSSALAGMKNISILLRLEGFQGPEALSRTVVEADLRVIFDKTGLEVSWLSEDPGLNPENYPLLVLSAQQGAEKGFLKPDLYLIDAQLRDIVTLAREVPLRTTAGLWQAMEHGYDMRAIVAIRKSLVNLSIRFLREYATANPQQLSPAAVDAIVVPEIKEKDPLEP